MSVMHIWVIDQINEPSASVEVDGTTVMTVPTWMLPEGAREGDVLRVQRECEKERAVLVIERDEEERRRRLERSKGQTEVRSKGDVPGDVVL